MITIRKSTFLLAFVIATPLAAQSAPVARLSEATSDERALRALEGEMGQSRADLSADSFKDFSIRPIREAAAKHRKRSATFATIKPDRLSDDDRTTYRILQFELSSTPLAEERYWLTFDLTPYVGPRSFLSAQQTLGSHPLATQADVRHYLQLVGSYAAMLDSLSAKVKAQAERGIYMPRATLPVVRSTWQGIAATTNMLRPADERITALAPDQRAKLLKAIDDAVDNRIDPGFAKLAALIGDAYEAKAPEAVGLGQYPGGKDLYRQLIRTFTTLPLTPEEIHQRGLTAVADIKERMGAIREQLGFRGTASEFYTKISTDARFIAKTPAGVEATYWRYIHAIEPKIASYFRVLPKAPYGVKRLPEISEAGQTFGFYGRPTKTEPRGLYNYNASNLPKRSLINAGTLIYHELIPGHHFHIATQNENSDLSPFRKQYGVTAFSEGWAEYAASLPIEMNLYDSPEALYGRYINELFLAARLVLDTGMNYFDWPLDKARVYMNELGALSDIEVDSETLRYSTGLPGQALGYRIGFEKMWELRHRAEQALGDRFDIRDFHDVVLRSGGRPLPIVESDIESYIAARKAGG